MWLPYHWLLIISNAIADSCEDSRNWCQKGAENLCGREYFCKTKWARKNCRRYCGICRETCEDTRKWCQKAAENRCGRENFCKKKWAKSHCRRMCGTCLDCSLCGVHKCQEFDDFVNCSCLAGYRSKVTVVCRDINECLTRDICGNHTCVNRDGSYECKCGEGFVNISPQTCIKAEMLTSGNSSTYCSLCGAHKCQVFEDVVNCSCLTGYQNFGPLDCRDIDECTERDICGSHTCINNEGSYECKCGRGFVNVSPQTCFEDSMQGNSSNTISKSSLLNLKDIKVKTVAFFLSSVFIVFVSVSGILCAQTVVNASYTLATTKAMKGQTRKMLKKHFISITYDENEDSDIDIDSSGDVTIEREEDDDGDDDNDDDDYSTESNSGYDCTEDNFYKYKEINCPSKILETIATAETSKENCDIEIKENQ